MLRTASLTITQEPQSLRREVMKRVPRLGGGTHSCWTNSRPFLSAVMITTIREGEEDALLDAESGNQCLSPCEIKESKKRRKQRRRRQQCPLPHSTLTNLPQPAHKHPFSASAFPSLLLFSSSDSHNTTQHTNVLSEFETTTFWTRMSCLLPLLPPSHPHSRLLR